MNLCQFTLETRLKEVEKILITVEEDKIYYENLKKQIIKEINEVLQPELDYSLILQ